MPPGAVPPMQPGSPAAAPDQEPRRGPLLVALVIIAVLSGAAMFASGFTLGLQQALAPGTPSDERELFDPFWEAYRKITTEYVGQVEPKELVEGAIKGMFGAVDDPYSSYMTDQEYQDSLGGISGEFEGIGAQMTTETPTGDPCDELGDGCVLRVVDVIRDSPAEKAGLLADDQLVAVDGEAVAGMTLEEVVAKVKGPRGTEVTLGLLRGGEALDLTIVRDVVRSVDVTSEVVGDGQVGYLDVRGFSASAAEDFTEQLKGFIDQGITRFVVDLRDDPGGFVDAARSIASEFVKSGPIYWEEYADGRQVPTDATGGGIATDERFEVAVLINGGSASASEILAGALQDTGRAVLVGERSFGKGTIQQWHLLSNQSGGFRLSVAKWLTPDKRWIHGTGLEPDVAVGAGATGTDLDPQLERAIETLIGDAAPSPLAPGSPSGSPVTSPVPSASPLGMGWPLRIGIEGPLRRFG
jgi:carboxyl-terminal processing protease